MISRNDAAPPITINTLDMEFVWDPATDSTDSTVRENILRLVPVHEYVPLQSLARN